MARKRQTDWHDRGEQGGVVEDSLQPGDLAAVRGHGCLAMRLRRGARAAEPTSPRQPSNLPSATSTTTRARPPQNGCRAFCASSGNRCEIVAAKGASERARVTGLFRLTAGGAEGVALRLNARESQRLQIHFWSGTLGSHRPPIHNTTRPGRPTARLRDADEPQPDRSTVCGRPTRSLPAVRRRHGGVQYHRGQLVLVRRHRLAASAFRWSADGVYLQIHGLIRGLSMVRCKEVPDRPDQRRPFLSTRQPAELPWMSQLAPKIVWNSLPNGEVELSAEENSQQGQIWTTVRRPGLYEYIFEVDSPGVGTGVYLGDDQGKPLCRVGFFRCAAARQVTFDLAPPWSNELEKHYNVQRQVVPFASRRQCIRLVLGRRGQLWTSDGVHWSQVTPKVAARRCWTWALLPAQPSARSALRARVRQLDAGFARLESVRSTWTSRSATTSKPGEKVAETRPDNVDAETWWRLRPSHPGGEHQGRSRPAISTGCSSVVSQPGEASSLLPLEESTLLRSTTNGKAWTAWLSWRNSWG